MSLMFSTRIVTIVILVLTLGAPTSLRSQSKSKSKLTKPLLVLHDANYPSFSFDGSRISVSPEIGLTEIYEIGTGKKVNTIRTALSEGSVLSADGTKIRIFSNRMSALYEVETGKFLSGSVGDISQNGKEIGKVWLFTASGLISKNITSDLNFLASFDFPADQQSANYSYPAVVIGRLDNNTLVRALKGDDDYVAGDFWEGVTMTPDGKFVAAERRSLSRLPRGKTAVWNTQTGKLIFSVPFHSYSLSLSDDGSRIATQRPPDDFTIEIWTTSAARKVSTISLSANGQKVKVNAMALSPDGRLLVTTRDEAFYFWDTESGEFLASQKQDDVSAGSSKVAVFSGDGRRIAVCTYDETITIWSVDDILKTRKK